MSNKPYKGFEPKWLLSSRPGRAAIVPSSAGAIPLFFKYPKDPSTR